MARGIKTGGRVKGSVNKTTAELRQLMSDFFAEKWGNVNEYFENLDDADKIKVLLAIAKFIVPMPIDNNEDSETPVYTGSQFNINSIEIIHTEKKKES